MAQRLDNAASDVTDSLRDKANDVKNNVQQLSKVARDVANEAFVNFRDNAENYLDKGRTMARDLEGQFVRQIRSNPVRSLLIASGVGIALGLILRSGSKK
jgi:ElaB/YqjD/DUF883 family membrane-anchored ribosome-binding protein